MTAPRLTIISVVRHDQPGLDLTIASASAECPWAEHLIVDGSDQPLRIAASHASLRVIRGRDRGISHAFNRGVMAATGDYVIFINAGDALISGAGDRILAALGESAPDCVWFAVYRCYENGMRAIYRPRLRLLKYAMAAPHQGMVVRRDVFAQVGLFPLQRYAMDHHLALRLLCAKPPHGIDVREDIIATYPAGGHSTQGGAKPFLTNCWNVARVAPRHLAAALLANSYLAIKSFIVQRMQ
jgi:glycosyltransferase involved in cell wall biosynthesis